MKGVAQLIWATIPAVFLALPALSQAHAAPEVVSITMSPQQQAAASALWTRRAIANAKPLIMIDRGASGVDSAAVDDSALTGPAGQEAAGAAAVLTEAAPQVHHGHVQLERLRVRDRRPLDVVVALGPDAGSD